MKLTIDFAAKTIKVEGTASMGELMDQLDKLFPHYEWRSYTLMQDVTYVPYNTQPAIWLQGNGTINIPNYQQYPAYQPSPSIPDWSIVTCENKDIYTINAVDGQSIASNFSCNDIVTLTLAETPGDILAVTKR